MRDEGGFVVIGQVCEDPPEGYYIINLVSGKYHMPLVDCIRDTSWERVKRWRVRGPEMRPGLTTYATAPRRWCVECAFPRMGAHAGIDVIVYHGSATHGKMAERFSATTPSVIPKRVRQALRVDSRPLRMKLKSGGCSGFAAEEALGHVGGAPRFCSPLVSARFEKQEHL